MIKPQKLELTWIGKDEQPRLEPRILIEDPERSYGDKNSGNMLIHGDNLLALKALEQDFAGQIKCACIDPPYNTGNAFEHYDDGLEHSIWLSLMKPRIEIIHKLLKDDGTLWIFIDDDESHYLKVLCDEVFGRKNFVANVIWEKKFSPQNDAKWLSDSHDHILVYAKNKEVWRPNLLPRTTEMDSRYKNPDNDPRGLWTSSDLSVKTYTPNTDYPITLPSGRVVNPTESRCWAVSKLKFRELVEDNRIWFGESGNNMPRLKRFLSEVQEGSVSKTIWYRTEVGDNQEAKREVKAFNDDDVFQTPKPERIIHRILTLASNEGDWVLDSFLGSGTTAAVAHKMKRRWIGIELGEHCHTHCLPRLKKVVDGTDQGGISKAVHTPNPSQEGSVEVLSSERRQGWVTSQLEIVNSAYPTCTDFERSFPSICFALATGVGKTRLMGAFAAYLYLSKGIRNFFVLAPNLTIYNKLIEDFSNTTHPKYVFKGIGEFVHNNPVIITGDNYNSVGDLYKEQEIRINVFNISKINSEMRGGKLPRIKRLSEYLGDSYFNYLSNLDDLVLLMDESHHYRADRGMEVINELNPVLGLELTATPQIERSGGSIKFKNVVYEYSLSKAIQDGFVKEPAVATRRDFDPSQYSLDDLDRIKLEDGVRIHEDTKVALDIFSRDNKMALVKPFVLVVAKDTDHARRLKELIVSSAFFEGRYADKVMEIHSNQTGEEKDENIAQLLSLEDHDNRIEIVIHVNMLKEGWDVTNLYTIIPLRTAAAITLRMQTIGRGLRLPYGKKIGNSKVDKLTIVAHDRFQEIIDEANKPDSIIRKENIITLDTEEVGSPKEVVTSVSVIEKKFEEEQKRIEAIADPEEKTKAQISLDVRNTILTTLPELNTAVTNISELKKEEIKQIALEKVRERIYSAPQQSMFAEAMVKEAEQAYEYIVEEFTNNIIEIPRIIIQQSNQVESGFRDFDLDAGNLNYQPVSEEILRRTLREREDDIVIGKGRIIVDSPENIIVNELINYPEIDYDGQVELLFKLTKQAVTKFRSYLGEDNLMNVVQYHKKEIGSYIYSQMMENFYCEAPRYEKPLVKPFTRIEEHNYEKYSKDSIHYFTDTITPTNAIPSKVFSGFRKACHTLYKFDTKTEKDFAAILEHDNAVLKWLRPSRRQFKIYWDHNSKQYHPDFVAETTDAIYMVETKKEGDIEATDVQEKAQAALQYCKHASDFTAVSGGKPWKYVLIPHNAVLANMSFDTLMKKYAFGNCSGT